MKKIKYVIQKYYGVFRFRRWEEAFTYSPGMALDANPEDRDSDTLEYHDTLEDAKEALNKFNASYQIDYRGRDAYVTVYDYGIAHIILDVDEDGEEDIEEFGDTLCFAPLSQPWLDDMVSNYYGAYVDFDDAFDAMDDDLKEAITCGIAEDDEHAYYFAFNTDENLCKKIKCGICADNDPQEFFDAYCILHRFVFGRDFKYNCQFGNSY